MRRFGCGEGRPVRACRDWDVWTLARLRRVSDEVSRCEEFAEDVTGFVAEERLLGQRRVSRSRRVDLLEVCPAVEVLRWVDGAVVAEVQEGAGVDLEVEVW
jgi:hypothetical protein